MSENLKLCTSYLSIIPKWYLEKVIKKYKEL